MNWTVQLFVAIDYTVGGQDDLFLFFVFSSHQAVHFKCAKMSMLLSYPVPFSPPSSLSSQDCITRDRNRNGFKERQSYQLL